VLLNVLADEIHRAHQRCLTAASCDPRLATRDLVFEAGATAMRALKGAYSCSSRASAWSPSATPSASGARPRRRMSFCHMGSCQRSRGGACRCEAWA